MEFSHVEAFFKTAAGKKFIKDMNEIFENLEWKEMDEKKIDEALYHIDMILWVMVQEDITKFSNVIEEARTFRDALAEEKMR